MKKFNLLLAALLGIGVTATQAQIGLVYSTNSIISVSANIVGGTIYSATEEGGSSLKGNLLSIDTSGSGYSDLHDFNGTDGFGPSGLLTISGNTIYGITLAGGANDSGCIYSISTTGTGFTVLHSFNGADGRYPQGGVILIGNVLYGNTEYGGAHQEGVLYSINTNGTGFTDLHDFTPAVGGSQPIGAITVVNGMIYGETSQGGSNFAGDVFSYNTTTQKYTDIYDLNAEANGYLLPVGHNLFGMTSNGGANADGYIFSIDTNGSGFRDMHDFTTPTDPAGTLTPSGATFYGADADDGPYGDGYLFVMDTAGTGFNQFYNFNGTYGEGILGSMVMLKGTLYGSSAAGGPQFGTIFKFGSDTNKGTGIAQLDANTGVNVYPNPSNGQFTIQSSVVAGQVSVEVYNALGEKVYSQLSTLNSQLSIDLSNQPAGVYLYRMINATGSLVAEGRLVIQK